MELVLKLDETKMDSANPIRSSVKMSLRILTIKFLSSFETF